MHDVWEEIRKHEACGVVYLQNKKWKVSLSSKSIDLGFNFLCPRENRECSHEDLRYPDVGM